MSAWAEDTVRILDGATFLVSDRNGDVDPNPSNPTGLFSADTRFLSRWQLTLNGERLRALSVDDLQYYEARFFLTSGDTGPYVDATLSIARHRWIGSGVHERITIVNHGEPATVAVCIAVESDFADIFGVKHLDAERAGRPYVQVDDTQLVLGYEREDWRRETHISANPAGVVTESGLSWTPYLKAEGTWTVEIVIETIGGEGQSQRTRRAMANDLTLWTTQAPRIDCPWRTLTDAYDRSLADLASLRTQAGVPAAGLPWFMTLFGRDSILTCLQVLPFVPQMAAATLWELARYQGTRMDDFREEEPGKILHEIRHGESAAFREQPHSPYYGAADTTPLFVILLDEYERWSGDAETVRQLEPQARAALNWIDTYGNLAGDGYIRYRRRNMETGLDNQCWKDSWDGISFADGRLPDPCRATCELQGYAYDAKMRAARLARTFWNDPNYANQLEREAASLKQRFNNDFWIEEGEYYALGLDSDGAPIDALSSNMGHLLWSGIVNDDRAAKVADRLLGPELFSGWGVRTLAEDQSRYNPIGYHVGTVWPFDNSFIAWGLRRYGFDQQAGQIAQAILEASKFFGGRLPEAFAGYPRQETRYPVQYPTACSPQAWSTGAPLLFIRIMLGLEPLDNHLVTTPHLPPALPWLGLLDVPGRWGRADAYGRRPTPRTWRPH